MAGQMPVGNYSRRYLHLIILSIILALSLAANGFFISKYRGLGAEVSRAVARADEAERQMKLLGEKLSEQLKESDAKARKLADENQGLRDKIEKINEERRAVIIGLEKRIEELATNESKLTVQIKGLNEVNRHLKQNLDASNLALIGQIKDGEEKAKRLGLLEAELSEIKGRSGQIASENDQLKIALAVHRETNKQLTAETNLKDAVIKKLRSDRAKLMEENKNLQKQIAEKVPAAQPGLVGAEEKEIADLKKALQEANSEKEALRAQYSTVIEEIKKGIGEREIEPTKIKEKFEGLMKAKEEELNRLKRTYDLLLKNLKEEMDRREVTIVRIKDMLSINVVSKILFGSGQAMLKPEGKKLLDKIIPALKESKDKEMIIEGHTDNVPISKDLEAIYPTNWELSTARATAVARYLEFKGVKPDSLSASGYSYFRPVASNETEEGRMQNRRIEIVLRPKDVWRQ